MDRIGKVEAENETLREYLDKWRAAEQWWRQELRNQVKEDVGENR